MTKGRLLFLFLLAGVIFALVIGVWIYQSSRGPSEAEIRNTLTSFTEKIAAGDLPGARELMTPGSRALLRDPGTALGESVYRHLSLVTVDRIYAENETGWAADAVLRMPDTLKIMAAAGVLFGEKVMEEGPAGDADRLMEDIYAEILSREDLPMLDRFCVIRFEMMGGRLLIAGDENLQQALEGESSQSMNVLEQLGK